MSGRPRLEASPALVLLAREAELLKDPRAADVPRVRRHEAPGLVEPAEHRYTVGVRGHPKPPRGRLVPCPSCSRNRQQGTPGRHALGLSRISARRRLSARLRDRPPMS